uniref:Uncharacterized protein n=1 Tax=Anguilla anguilla TaxID=7936 RepID=A0A0E9W5X5_ANGAN
MATEMHRIPGKTCVECVEICESSHHSQQAWQSIIVWQLEGCRFKPCFGHVEVSLSKTPNP